MSGIKGIDKVTQKINNAIARLKKTSTKGLKSASLYVAAEAVKRTPIESGDLRNSVYVDLDSRRVASGQDGIVGINTDVGDNATLAAIGFASKYAAKQHEDLSLSHDRTDGYRIPEINQRTGKPNKYAGRTVNMIPGGQAKFLESVLIDDQEKILQKIAAAIDLGGNND